MWTAEESATTDPNFSVTVAAFTAASNMIMCQETANATDKLFSATIHTQRLRQLCLGDGNVDALLDRLDGSSSDRAWEAAHRLRDLLGDSLPSYLLARYRTESHWGPRTAYVFHAIGYARQSDDAVNLGKLAVGDRSKVVRYRGCMLLAYSLRRDLLPFLEQELKNAKDEETQNDIIAAMDSIVEQNYNYFVDREHTGKVTWRVSDY